MFQEPPCTVAGMETIQRSVRLLFSFILPDVTTIISERAYPQKVKSISGSVPKGHNRKANYCINYIKRGSCLSDWQLPAITNYVNIRGKMFLCHRYTVCLGEPWGCHTVAVPWEKQTSRKYVARKPNIWMGCS